MKVINIMIKENKMDTYITKEDKVAYVIKMDELVREMNDEAAVMWWLEEGVPDHIGEIDEDDIEYFTEDEPYAELVGLFLAINAEYPEEEIGEKLKAYAYERRK